MEVVLQVIGFFFAAAFAWITLEFVGRPLRKFFDLRGEIIRRLNEFANVRARLKEVPDSSGAISCDLEEMDLSAVEIARLEEAQRTFRDLASQMQAFAQNETFAQYVAELLLRYKPQAASAALIGLSNSYDTYGASKARHRDNLRKALRIQGDSPRFQRNDNEPTE